MLFSKVIHMNWKRPITYFLLFCLGIGTCLGSLQILQKQQSNSSSIQVISNSGIFTEKKIQESTEQYKIRAYYPYTAYEILNNQISSFIQKNIEDFKNDVKNSTIPKLQSYTLDIRYDTYSYKNFVSYVFYIFLDTGGAHPNTYIHTISFDKNKNTIITIDSLIEKNPKLLEILSKESFEQLQNSEKFQNGDFQNIQNMVIDGTKATANNFRNFAFSEKGFILFFENYQVAPYVYGGFQVTLPYFILNLGI